MSRRKSAFEVIGIAGTVLLLAACGGSDGGGGTVSAGATATVTSGTITGFGSVILSDKRFDTSGASFVVDGQSGASQSDLKLGQVVQVTGSFDGTRRSASQIVQKDAVEGPVQSVASDGLSLVVMGQTVLVDGGTLIDNNIPGQNVLNLAAGTDIVEVSGQVRADGVIGATLIERKLGAVTLEVHGFVTNHDAAARTFQIGNLTVVYPPTALIGDMPNPAGNAWNGLLVEVNGAPFVPGPNAQTQGTLTATKVEPDGLRVANVARVEVEGFVRQVSGPGDFFVGNVHVVTTGSTLFRGGTIDEIAVGTKVEAEGSLANGILTASKITFKDNVRLEADAAVVNVGNGTLLLTGLPSLTVQVNSGTEFRGQGTPTRLSDLAAGDHLRIRGRRGTGTIVIATSVERRSADSEVDLQGPVEAVSNSSLTILGVTANTTGISENDFKGLDDNPIGRAAFFNAVNVGTVVKVKGRLSGGGVTWREAELEE